MNLVTVSTVEEMKSILQIVFWPAEDRFRELEEADLEFDEICRLMDTTEEELMEFKYPGREVDTDLWYEGMDSLTSEDIKAWALDAGNFEAIKNFEPSCVIWHFNDSFDRAGDMIIRIFDIVPLREMTPQYWIDKYNNYQAEREAEYQRYKELRLV